MLFNSFEFLLFFPIVTVLYFLISHRYRWLHLLTASIIFYMAFVPVYFLILAFTIIIDYFAGIAIENANPKNRKPFLIASIVANVGVLAIFKYYNFFASNINEVFVQVFHQPLQLKYLSILLPIGLSFHTFQAMSYTMEVYRGKQKAERNFGIYALYVMFYPQLVAGPIERPQNILPQLHQNHPFDYENMRAGLMQMLYGFFKKIVIADSCAIIANAVFGAPDLYGGYCNLLAIFCFTIQIYCDFSGYSDIAIGAARVMGIHLMKNFETPYFSKTIAEFWSRWHISLSTWFRDYLYIPLGGNRVSKNRWYLNLFIVFMVSGFWHGANWTFIFWGFLHGCYLIIALLFEPYKKRFSLGWLKSNAWQMFSTFVLVSFAWIFFRADNFSIAQKMISGIFHFSASQLSTIQHGFLTSNQWFMLLISFTVFAWMEVNLTEKYMIDIFKTKAGWIRWATYFSLALLILVGGKFTETKFIYFQF